MKTMWQKVKARETKEVATTSKEGFKKKLAVYHKEQNIEMTWYYDNRIKLFGNLQPFNWIEESKRVKCGWITRMC